MKYIGSKFLAVATCMLSFYAVCMEDEIEEWVDEKDINFTAASFAPQLHNQDNQEVLEALVTMVSTDKKKLKTTAEDVYLTAQIAEINHRPPSFMLKEWQPQYEWFKNVFTDAMGDLGDDAKREALDALEHTTPKRPKLVDNAADPKVFHSAFLAAVGRIKANLNPPTVVQPSATPTQDASAEAGVEASATATPYSGGIFAGFFGGKSKKDASAASVPDASAEAGVEASATAAPYSGGIFAGLFGGKSKKDASVVHVQDSSAEADTEASATAVPYSGGIFAGFFGGKSKKDASVVHVQDSSTEANAEASATAAPYSGGIFAGFFGGKSKKDASVTPVQDSNTEADTEASAISVSHSGGMFAGFFGGKSKKDANAAPAAPIQDASTEAAAEASAISVSHSGEMFTGFFGEKSKKDVSIAIASAIGEPVQVDAPEEIPTVQPSAHEDTASSAVDPQLIVYEPTNDTASERDGDNKNNS